MEGEKILLKIPKVGEIYLRGVLEASNSGILAVSSDGHVLYRNTLFSKLWRIPKEILKTNDDNKLLNFVLDQLKNPEEFMTKVKELYASNKILTDFVEFKDGRVFERTSTSLLDKRNLLGRVWSFRDVTKSRQDEKAILNVMEDLEETKDKLELEKAKYEAMLTSIGEGVIAVDNQGKVMIMNEIAESMLGIKTKDMVGKDLVSLPLEGEDNIPVQVDKRPTIIALATGEAVKGTYLFIRKNKTKFPIAITATPVKLGGKTIGLIEIIRDVTHELEIDHAKSEFVSLASHQLRTPLGIMKWYLEALQNDNYVKKSPTSVREYFNEIVKSNERVLGLVRDLLSVSRIEQGKVKNIPELIDPIKIVKEITEQLRIIANKKRVVLKLTIQNENISPINIDVLRFHQVIENLVINAIEYSSAADSVNVNLNKIEDNLLISVKDTGIGISKVDQKKLFTKFFRTENAIGYNPEGSGLGLYVVNSYVENWGGKITVESVEGKGSTFTISLPIKGVTDK